MPQASRPRKPSAAIGAQLTMKTFIDWSGWIAALLILGAYGLLSMGKVQPHSKTYQWMNILGAFGFIINCTWNAAWPSVAMNVIWVGIGVYALRRNRRAGP
jgi:hypothetical protein